MTADPRVTSGASRFRGRVLFGRGMGLSGLLAGVVIAVLVNLFAARYNRRWDFTPDRRYTPPAAIRHLLEPLTTDVTIVVLLARTDPSAAALEQLLSSYRSLSRRVTVDWVDPDREPLRFEARQAELDLSVGQTEDGKVASDAVLVVLARGRRYFIEAEELLGLDPDATDGLDRAEHAIAVALHSVLERTAPTVCVTEGHRELALSDRSPVGLSRLKERLEQDSVSTKAVDLGQASLDALKSCRLVIVAAPDVPLAPNAVAQLTQATAWASLLLLGGATPDESGRLTSMGLEPLARLAGIELATDVVIEEDRANLLPNVFGETFLAIPAEHVVTRGLFRQRDASPLKVVVSLAQSMSPSPGSGARPLLTSSASAVALRDISATSVAHLDPREHGPKSHVVAMAGSIPPEPGGPRRIAVAPANIVQNRTFDGSGLIVTQSFALSLVSWLLATESTVLDFEPRPGRSVSVEISDEQLHAIARYTGLVMPGCFLLMGIAVLLMRRRNHSFTHAEGRSR